ncbi:MAG: hypothetical protein AAGF88_12775 [Pseudomonadota bacterium]
MTFEPVHWTEWLKAVGPAVIAAFVAYVAYQQWQTNKATLREKLFDRRLKLFESTQEFFGEVIAAGRVNDKALSAIWNVPLDARFLFDQKLANHLQDIKKHALAAKRFRTRIDHPKNEDDIEKNSDLEDAELTWFVKESTSLHSHFEPYLRFGKF